MATIAVGLACSTGTQSSPSPRAAVVDGQTITLDQIDERIRRQLFEEQFATNAEQLYSARRGALDEMIDEQLLVAAADEAGVSPEAFLDAAAADLPPIGDDRIQSLFEANRDRLPADARIETYSDQIRAHLEAERTQEILTGLRAGHAIEIDLPRQRNTVEPIGPSQGPEDAPVTLVEFSDFQCPYCARSVGIVTTLLDRYPDTLRVVYRHLPLSFHEQARGAAIASVCADRAEAFWPYHDLLFERPDGLDRDALIGHAESLGLDRETFVACLDGPDAAAIVEADVTAARAAGATGTPTFFVNGIKLTGARPIEELEALIDDELERVGR